MYARAGHYRWTTSGPEAGFVYQIVVSPSDQSRILAPAGLFGRLLFESNDAGGSWIQSENVLYVGRLAQSPADPDALYTIGSTGSVYGILKSSDRGATWFLAEGGLPDDFQPWTLAAAPSQAGTAYVISNGQPAPVYRTLDGGVSWTLASSAVTNSYPVDMVVDANDGSTVYLATSTEFLKSTDGGTTWQPLTTAPLANRLFFDGRAPAVLYATVSSNGLSMSTDGGASWQPAAGTISDHTFYDLAFDPSDSQKLYAATAGTASSPGGLFVSTNRGQTWSPVTLDSPATIATAVAVDPLDASRIYTAASAVPQQGVFHASVDGGQTWTTLGSGLSGHISHDVACDAAVADSAYAVSNANVYRTDDAGGSWTLQGTTPYAIVSLAVDPTNSQNLYAGTLTLGVGGVIRSVDGGVTWNPASSGLTLSNLYQVAISPSAPDHVLVAGYEALYETVDGGDSWSPILTDQMRSAAFDPADSSILYAGVWPQYPPGGDGLLRSDDGGTTWNPPAGLPESGVLSIKVPANDPTHVYVALSQGVYRSADHGLSFATASTGLLSGFSPMRLAMDASNPATLLVLGSPSAPAPAAPAAAPAPIVFRTTDGADSWKPVPSVLPLGFGIFDVGVATGGRTFYASTYSGVFNFSRSFTDVPDSDPFWSVVDAAAMNGVTVGCGSGQFCPASVTSRASLAAFLLRGKNGGLYAPPPATGTVFADVPKGSLAADFIEELANEGITSGCGGGDYCPSAPVTRAETAVLVLKTLHGAGFVPPPATGTVFGDVPIDAFAAAWIEELFHEGISAGCGGGDFCPDTPLIRAQAAALIVHAFGLS
jgi:photosystem II stability/assembly factor-like uncharacterized protein